MFSQSLKREARVLYHFTVRYLLVFIDDYWNTLIDSLSWPVLTALIYGYISPTMGLEAGYAGFMIVGSVVALAYYVIFGLAYELTMDIDSVRTVDFELCLPVRPELIVLKTSVLAAMRAFLMTVPLPFLCKLLLWNTFDLSALSIPKYLLAYGLSCLMIGFFMMAVGGGVELKGMVHFRVRVVDVVFFSGCFIYSWAKYFEASPILGYLILLNPMTYAMEGVKAATVAHPGHLNFWVCCAVMVGCSVAFYLYALRTWRRRLDYVPVYN